MPFRTRNFARLCAATALAAGATGFFAAPAFAAVPDSADFAITTNDITGANGAPLPPGSDAVVSTTIKNASSVVITGFELSVTLPKGVTFKGAEADGWKVCEYETQTVTCDLSNGWALVPAGQEDEPQEIYSSWKVDFKVAVAEDAKGPKLTGGKSTGKITSAADLETGAEAEIAAEAAEFKPASFTGTDSGVTLASFKETPGHGKGGGRDRYKHGNNYGSGGHDCGKPPTENPPTSPPVTTPPATTPPVTTPPATTPPATTPPATTPPATTPPATTPPATTPPATTPPATPPVVHSAEFAALVALPGGNGGGGEEPPLPNTGVQVGVIGGLGAAVVVAGAAMFMMARRRRVVTVAPGDGNSSL
jgi:LPXTG-motif cell wall-anchored protein